MADQLKHAVEQMQAARARYQAATTKRTMRDAAEDLEFWSNKAAMLEVMVRKGGAA
jgi:hypothetical protein